MTIGKTRRNEKMAFPGRSGPANPAIIKQLERTRHGKHRAGLRAAWNGSLFYFYSIPACWFIRPPIHT